MRLSIKSILLLSFVYTVCFLEAQEVESDARLWLHVKTSVRLNKKLNLEITIQNRFYENMSQYSRRFFCPAVEYRLFKQLRLLTGYAYGGARRADGTYTNAHQAWAGLQARFKEKRFSIIYRNLLQINMEDIYSSENGASPRLFERNKLTLKYEVGKRLDVFAGAEANTPLYRTIELPVRRLRAFAGFCLAFNKHSSLEPAFVFQKNYRYSSPASRDFIYALTYMYSF